MSTTPFITISDLRDPSDPQGRSYREVNAAKQHNIPVGALVEVEPDEYGPERRYKNRIRLFVVYHARDCDQTPLYCLSADPTDTHKEREGFYNYSWVKGIPEESLTVIELPDAEK